ncbi:hypothetical protein MXB_1582, partial [Myxobolus squamalis]
MSLYKIELIEMSDSLLRKLAYELKIEHAKMEGVKQQHDYAVEILKEEAKTHRTKAEYEDFLARKRQEDRLQMEVITKHPIIA